MPFTDGVFVNVSGASSAAPGQTIQSTVWNAIHEDYSAALNELSVQLVNTTAFKNVIWMNGGFELWQRGTSIAVTAGTTVYTADRWYIRTGANQASTVSRQAGLSNNSEFCARVARNTGQTGVTEMLCGFPLDTDEVLKLRGKFVYLTIKLRAGANFSPTGGFLFVEAAYGTGASPAKRDSMSGFTASISQAIALTTSTQTVQVISTVIVPTTATQFNVSCIWTPVGTAGAADYFEVDDVQITAVPAAAVDDYLPDAFEYIPLYVSLEGCKTHYQKTFSYDVAPASGGGVANSLKVYTQAAETFGYWWAFAPELRVNAVTNGYSKYHPTTATSSNWLNVGTGASSSATFSVLTTIDSTKGIMIIASASATAIASTMLIHAAVSAGI